MDRIAPSIKRTLLMCIKAPSPGDVKTRLIPEFTAEEAAALYRCFVVDSLSMVSRIPMDVRLLVTYQFHPKHPTLSWLGLKKAPAMFRQEGRSLGEKIQHGFGIAFGRGAQHAVMIGCDTPTLPAAAILSAFKALETADVVLGPTPAGSYYLVGLSRPCTKLFDDVCWSGDQIFERTAANAQNQGYRLRVLPTHYDVDTLDNVRRLRQDLSADPLRAPVTAKFLGRLLSQKPDLAV